MSLTSLRLMSPYHVRLMPPYHVRLMSPYHVRLMPLHARLSLFLLFLE